MFSNSLEERWGTDKLVQYNTTYLVWYHWLRSPLENRKAWVGATRAGVRFFVFSKRDYWREERL